MKVAPIPADESDRMAELNALNILDTPREPRFDNLTDLVSDVLEVPMVFLTLVDGDRCWYKSTSGIEMESSARAMGFCGHAIFESEVMVVPNTTEDARFADNPYVTGEFHARFYAGVPLHGPKGKAIGVLGIIDTQPRQFSDKQVGQLRKFAALLEAEIRR
jgi:GAF domain-containing protein